MDLLFLLLLLQYTVGNPIYMGPRYRRITENKGLLEKDGNKLLSCAAQRRNLIIDYHLTAFIIIYLF
jgi:hypothetical protein